MSLLSLKLKLYEIFDVESNDHTWACFINKIALKWIGTVCVI